MKDFGCEAGDISMEKVLNHIRNKGKPVFMLETKDVVAKLVVEGTTVEEMNKRASPVPCPLPSVPCPLPPAPCPLLSASYVCTKQLLNTRRFGSGWAGTHGGL